MSRTEYGVHCGTSDYTIFNGPESNKGRWGGSLDSRFSFFLNREEESSFHWTVSRQFKTRENETLPTFSIAVKQRKPRGVTIQRESFKTVLCPFVLFYVS